MNIYSIYRATNTNTGKVYVGHATRWPGRMAAHKCQSKTIQNKFYNAIRKYGWESFQWHVIYQSMDGDHCLKVMEPYFIAEYDSFKNGYNSTLGGEGNLVGTSWNKGLKLGPMSLEQRKIRSDALKGKPKSIEHRMALAAANIGHKPKQEYIDLMKSTWRAKLDAGWKMPPDALSKRSITMKATLAARRAAGGKWPLNKTWKGRPR